LLVIAVAVAAPLRNAEAVPPIFNWAVQDQGGTTNDEGFAVAVDTNGNTYVTGVFQSRVISLGSRTLTNYVTNLTASNANIFVAKINPFGNVVWATSVGGSSNDGPNAIAVDGVGNSYVTGVIGSLTPKFGSITVTNNNTNGNGSGNMFLAKFDTNGVPLWVTQAAAASSNASGYQIAVNASGNGVVLGLFLGSLTIAGTNFNSGNGDYFLTRFSSSGTLSNAIQFGGSLFFASGRSGVGFDASSNIYVAGTFSSATAAFGANTLYNSGIATTGNIFLFKLDTNENYLWLQQCDGNGSDNTTVMAVDPAGNTYLSLNCLGQTNQFGAITLTTNTGDTFIAKFDTSGNALWVDQAAVTGPYNSATVGPEGIAADAAGNCFTAGHTVATNFSFGTVGFTNATTNLAEESFIFEFDPSGHPLWSRSLAGTNAIVAMALDSGDQSHVTGWFKGAASFGSHTLSGGNFEQIFIAELSSTNNPPRLDIALAGTNAVLSWSTNPANYTLYMETNLTQGAWTPASGTVATAGTNYVLTNGLSPNPRFYRLVSP
jgi:hypothetical protein